MYSILSQQDELTTVIYAFLTKMLEKHPTMESAEFAYSDITDIGLLLPPVETLTTTEFFARPPLIFRLLHRTLDFHLVNPITEEAALKINVSPADRTDPRIFEHIWLLLLLGASVSDIGNPYASTVTIFMKSFTQVPSMCQ